jgi:hypothetical protein
METPGFTAYDYSRFFVKKLWIKKFIHYTDKVNLSENSTFFL